MITRGSITLLAGLSFLFVPVPAALAVSGDDLVAIPGVREFSGRLIARPVQPTEWRRQGLTASEATAKVELARAEMDRHDVIEFVQITDEYIINVPNGRTEAEVVRELMSTGAFQYVTPDWIVYPTEECPGDSRFVTQWHHNADHLRSCEGWSYHQGEPTVSVGICDTGLRVTHEDFLVNRLEGYNAVDRRWENDGGDISDINGHGTGTTGCAAANGDNGVGIAGVGWNLSHRILKVSNSPGGGSSITVLTHAARTSIQAGDRVANVSYSGVESPSVMTTGTEIKNMGGLLVWSAGNEGRNLIAGDRDDDDVIVVGATNHLNYRAGFSNYGPYVDLMAPGEAVYTTSALSDRGYGYVDGTSFAAPLTAGLIGLVWSYKPDLTPDEVETLIKENCDDLGEPGIDDQYGYGRISVYRTVRRAGEPILLGVSDLVSGELAAIDVEGCIPTAEVRVYVSLRGPGSCTIPDYGISLDIQNCQLAVSGTTDSVGVRTWSVITPRVNQSVPVALQACQNSTGSQDRMVSNVVLRRVRPSR